MNPVSPKNHSQQQSVRSNEIVDYWEKSVPWVFRGEHLTYAEKRRLRYELQDYMLAAIPFHSFKSKLVLEIGSGGGIDSAEFGRHGSEVISIDLTKTGVATTRNTLREAGVIPHVVRASAQNLPFRGQSVDCVYSFGVLHHIPAVKGVVAEISRILKSDGEIIIMLYNTKSLLYAYSILFLHRDEGLSEQELVQRYSERNLNSPYTITYTKEEACRLFSEEFDSRATVHYNVIDTAEQRKVKLSVADDYELGWHIIVRGKRKNSKNEEG